MIRNLVSNNETPEFEFIYINGMSLTNPNVIYTILAEKIIGKRMSPYHAALFLDTFFRAPNKSTIVCQQLGINYLEY